MKKRILIPWKVVVLVIFSILLSYTFAHAVDLAAEFDGPGSDYCDAANWDIMVIPCNAGSVFFDVNIPGIFSVNACGSSCEVNIFLLENNSSFIIPGGSSYIPLVSADIYGIINSTGGTFNATGVGAAFPGNRARVWASAGGQVVIGAPTYSSTGLFTNGNSNWTLFSASNLGTLLDLSALQSIDAGFNDGDTSYNATVHKITASDSGIIDLSGLATVTAPSRWDDRIEFTVNGNASINLSSLGTIATAGRGQTKFIVSNAVSLSLPALQTASHVMFDVSSGSTVTADGSPAAYSSTGLFTNGNSNWTLFSAANPGTLLDLSALQSLNAGFNDGDTSYNATVHKITASDSGIIDLSGLTTVTAPSQWDDRIEFTVNGNASINLSSLGTIATAGRGQTKFIVSNAVSLSLPALQTASHVMFDVSSGSTVTADGSPAAYSSTGLFTNGNSNWTLFSAANPGTLLDLSALQSLNAGFNDGDTSYNATVHKITASDSGIIDLSGLTSVATPVQPDDRLEVNISGEGKLILGTLCEAGRTPFTVNGPNTTLEVQGDVCFLNDPVTLTMSEATLKVSGDLPFSFTNEENFVAGDSIVHFNGDSEQLMEVGGLNVDVMVEFLTNDNFGFGQMILGQIGQPTVVRLIDEADNGNGFIGCRQSEALYLFGLGEDDPNGLKIVGGSTLILDRINLYALEEGEWIHINKLFLPGEKRIFYGDGFIEMGAVPGDTDANGALDGNDLAVLTMEFGRSDCTEADPCQSDFYGDGDVDKDDLACFANNFGRLDY